MGLSSEDEINSRTSCQTKRIWPASIALQECSSRTDLEEILDPLMELFVQPMQNFEVRAKSRYFFFVF